LDKVTLRAADLPVLPFCPDGFIALIFISMLLLPEGQMDVAWEPSKKTMLLRKSESFAGKSAIENVLAAGSEENLRALHVLI
jgi:hypothetical protein